MARTSLSYKLLVEPCSPPSTKTMILELFPTHTFPRGEQYAHWGSKWDGKTYGVWFKLSLWTWQLWFQLCPSFLSSVSFTLSLWKLLTLAVSSHSTGLLSCSVKPPQDRWTDILDTILWPWQKGQIQYCWRVIGNQSCAFNHTGKIHMFRPGLLWLTKTKTLKKWITWQNK